MKFKLPIVISTSLVAMLLLFIHGGLVFFVSVNEIEIELRNRAMSELQNLGRSSQRMIEHLYAENDEHFIRQIVADIDRESQSIITTVLTPDFRILASGEEQIPGEVFNPDIVGVDGSELKRLMNDSRVVSKKYMLWSQDRLQVMLMIPVVLGAPGEIPNHSNVGLILLHQDLSWIGERVFSVLRKQQIFLWLGYLAFIAVLGVVIYTGVIKRIKHITGLAARISAGDRSLRADDPGSDEIGFLARFFNEMLDSMEAHQFVLSSAFDEISNRERNLTMTLQSIGDAVVVTDAEGHVTRMNPVACQLTGWTEADAIGVLLEDVFKVVDSTNRNPLKSPVQEVLKRREVIELGGHTTLISRSGHEYYISDSAAPIKDESGTIHGVIMVFQDITEEYGLQLALQQSEQRLRMALQATEEGLWDWDINSGKVYYSERWITMLGYGFGEVMPDISSWKRLIHPDDVVDVMEKLQTHLKGNIPQFEAEHRLRKVNGSYLWVRGRGKVTEYDRQGKPARMVGTVSDISAEKEHEDHMRRAQKMEAMGKLTGGIAHDYNNMLGVILGYAELLQLKIGDDPKQSMYIESILRAADRAKKLTNSLLKFSRRKDTSAEAVDLNTLIREDEDMLSRTLTAKVELELDLASDLWTVFMDAGDLEDAILNMSINAMHAMPRGGTLRIATRNVSLNEDDARVIGLGPGDYVCVSLQDSGEGMDEDTMERIFDPFFSTKGDQGTGLGLSQVYGFVARSQGGIRVQSQPGEGTVFEMYFPRHNQQVGESRQFVHSRDRSFTGNETILVVDDEYALRSLSEEILTGNGYKVLLAQDGFEALRLLEGEHIDLVVTDVIMPGMNGYQLARQIRDKHPEVQIQIVSGFNSLGDDLEVDEDLCKMQLAKPFNANDLLRRVRELLDDEPAA